MLNEYHLQFLRRLTKSNVRFIVIGGQARAFHFGSYSRDLDLWVDISDAQKPLLEKALLSWAETYPAHTYPELRGPLPIYPNMQLKLPDTDGCYYLGSDGEPVEIGPEDGIDLLTSVADADFEQTYFQTVVAQLGDGILLRLLSPDDLDRISPYKGDPRRS